MHNVNHHRTEPWQVNVHLKCPIHFLHKKLSLFLGLFVFQWPLTLSHAIACGSRNACWDVKQTETTGEFESKYEHNQCPSHDLSVRRKLLSMLCMHGTSNLITLKYEVLSVQKTCNLQYYVYYSKPNVHRRRWLPAPGIR